MCAYVCCLTKRSHHLVDKEDRIDRYSSLPAPIRNKEDLRCCSFIMKHRPGNNSILNTFKFLGIAGLWRCVILSQRGLT